MLLCPKCKDVEMRFTVHMRVDCSVRIECYGDGDYQELDEREGDVSWRAVQCMACEAYVNEDEARDCFDNQPDEEVPFYY
jgi:hypothetical protein